MRKKIFILITLFVIMFFSFTTQAFRATYFATEAIAKESIAVVLYKKFVTQKNDRIVVIKLFLYSEPFVIQTEKDWEILSKHRAVVRRVVEVFCQNSWLGSCKSLSDTLVITESVGFEVDTSRRNDVVWAYRYPCDSQKLYNKIKKRNEGFPEYFKKIVNTTERCIRENYKLK